MRTISRPYLILLIISLLAAGSSIAFLSHTAQLIPAPYPALETGMSDEYARLTRNLVHDQMFSMSTTSPLTPDAWRTPGYPAFIAPFYMLSGSFYPVLFAQILVLFATTVLLYRMSLTLLSPRWALGLSVLYILLPDTLLSVSSLLTENVFVFLFMSAIYICFFSQIGHLYVRWPLAGFLLALTVYIRPASLYIMLFLIPGYFLLYLPWREIRLRNVVAGALTVLVFAGTLMPWCIRNQQVLGVFTFASTGPYVLFRQNAVQFYEGLHDIPNLEARYALEDMAGVPRGPVPMDPKYSAALQHVALKVILEHPVRYAFFHATTFIPFFTSSGINDYWRFVQDMNPDTVIPPEPSLLQAIHPFSLPTLLIVLKNHGWTLVENAFWGTTTLLMLLGLWYSKNRRLMWMLFVIIMYFAAVTGPIAHARYRVPADPFILLIAASALSTLSERYRERRVDGNSIEPRQ